MKAENFQEASSIVREQYNKGEIVLDHSDFIQVEFIDINKKSSKDEMDLLV